MIKQLLIGLVRILFLKGGPQDLPYSPLLLGALLILGTVLMSFISGGHVVLLLSNLAFTLMIIWLLLYFTRKQERYIQTATALIACDWIMSLVFGLFWYGILLLSFLMGSIKGVTSTHWTAIFSIKLEKDTLPASIMGILVLGAILLAVWKLLIDIRIIRQATEWRLLRAVAFILLLNFVPAMVQQQILHKENAAAVPTLKAPINITPN